jgi:hypothetical protein
MIPVGEKAVASRRGYETLITPQQRPVGLRKARLKPVRQPKTPEVSFPDTCRSPQFHEKVPSASQNYPYRASPVCTSTGHPGYPRRRKR